MDGPASNRFPVSQSLRASARVLSEEEQTRLKNDQQTVPTYKQLKFEEDACKNWDLFYKRNSTNFFKDRHWTHREFDELCENDGGLKKTLLEVGCGVGNTIFPLIEESRTFFVYACDFSPRAVAFVKENKLYNESLCKAFQNDVTTDDLRDHIPESSVDVVTLFFVLSSILPAKMLAVLSNIFKVLKPGGVVLFRDYGLYDHAMLRFKPGHKLSENFYVRQDGTRAYYFSKEFLSSLFSTAGYETVSNDFVHRQTVNKKEGLCVPRIFVQGKFRKPEDI